MQIKEVENLTGITSYNIRYYEKEKLIQPHRNKVNGYREYTNDDVSLINKIKFLRMLDVPVNIIREYIDGNKTFENLIEEQVAILNEQEQKISQNRRLCEHMIKTQISSNPISDEWINTIFDNRDDYMKRVEKIQQKDRWRGKIFFAKQIAMIAGWIGATILCIVFFLQLISGYASKMSMCIDVALIIILIAMMIRTIWLNEKANQ